MTLKSTFSNTQQNEVKNYNAPVIMTFLFFKRPPTNENGEYGVFDTFFLVTILILLYSYFSGNNNKNCFHCSVSTIEAFF